MVMHCCTTFLLTVAVAAVRFVDPASSKTLAGDSRHDQLQQHDPLPKYFWMCPSVECPPLPDDCVDVEYLVYVFQYSLPPDLAGHQATINVRCQTCHYCLDRPSRSRSRSKSERGVRGAAERDSEVAVDRRGRRRLRRFATSGSMRGRQCRQVDSCPAVSTQCRDVRLTRVLFHGSSCRVLCPACFDTVLIPDAAVQ